jgi:type IV pilus assembly protein PilA
MNKKNHRKGFTIVELVIVIAVIAILATVLIPTFGNMIQKANNSKTLQALKNEYTEYALSVDVNTTDIEEDMVIKYGDKYYTIDNGAPVVKEDGTCTEATLTADTDYWDAASNTWKKYSA